MNLLHNFRQGEAWQ